jgi:hypothetical protein
VCFSWCCKSPVPCRPTLWNHSPLLGEKSFISKPNPCQYTFPASLRPKPFKCLSFVSRNKPPHEARFVDSLWAPSPLSLIHPSAGNFQQMNTVYQGWVHLVEYFFSQLSISIVIFINTWMRCWKSSLKIVLFLHVHKFQHTTMKINFQLSLCPPTIRYTSTNLNKYLFRRTHSQKFEKIN